MSHGLEARNLHVTSAPARFLMITIGADSVGFLREVGEAYRFGPTIEQLVAIAGRHGVEPRWG